jgi:hypothetical protein
LLVLDMLYQLAGLCLGPGTAITGA